MISYAQNAEDVVLARLFGDRATGRYVDVGAGDPVHDSVTKHFYDLGWRGINIEPAPDLAEQLRVDRPEDVTLQVAAGAKAGTATLHLVVDNWGRSTLDARLARRYAEEDGWSSREVEVEVVTLADVLAAHPGPVDFLKVDVEGVEADVLTGADWTQTRPRVVVVEATEPGARAASHGEWEPILLGAGYRCVLFDGLNRFYADAGDAEAADILAAPVNIFDTYERYVSVLDREAAREAGRSAANEEHAVERAAEVAYIRKLDETIRALSEENAAQRDRIAELQATIDKLNRDAAGSARYAAGLEARLTELES